MVLKVLDYIENVLEVPRDEYNGMPVCPFANKERKNNNIYITGNNGVLLSLDQTKVSFNEYYPANDEGCSIHISIKKLKNDLSDSILNGLVINDAMLAVTASGIKQIELK